MHKIAIPHYMVERVTQLRGKEHCFDDSTAHAALLVVDMQNAYMLKGVAHALCEPAQEIVPTINRLARAVRAAGAPVYGSKPCTRTRHGRAGPSPTRWRASKARAAAPRR